MNKIFCLGDGYAHGHIWPEWPQILQALVPEYQVSVISGIGAGNEFLVTELLDLGNEIQDHLVIFQWAQHNRFDKLVEDEHWEKIGKSDPVYHFNFYQRKDRHWWLSSGSTTQRVNDYHNLVQNKQSVLRSNNYRILVSNYLQNKGCKFYFTSTQEQETYAQQPKFQRSRGNEVQPSPLIHFNFLQEIILPNISLTVSQDRMLTLEKRISQQIWVPYDPDRDEIWHKIKQF